MKFKQFKAVTARKRGNKKFEQAPNTPIILENAFGDILTPPDPKSFTLGNVVLNQMVVGKTG